MLVASKLNNYYHHSKQLTIHKAIHKHIILHPQNHIYTIISFCSQQLHTLNFIIYSMTYYLNFICNNQTHKTLGGYPLNHDSLMAVNHDAKKRLSFYFIAEQTPQKLTQGDFEAYKQLKKTQLYKYLPLDIFAVGLFAYRTLFYRPRLSVPSQRLGALGFAGRALGFIALSSAYFAVMDRHRESKILGSELVKDLSTKYNFGVYDFSLVRKEASLIKIIDMLRW